MSILTFNDHITILTDTEKTPINLVSIYPNIVKDIEHNDKTNKVLSKYKLESFNSLKIYKKTNQPTKKLTSSKNQPFIFNFRILVKPFLLDFFQTKKDTICIGTFTNIASPTEPQRDSIAYPIEYITQFIAPITKEKRFAFADNIRTKSEMKQGNTLMNN